MNVIIRPQSDQDPALMAMLRFESARMIGMLVQAGIDVPDGKAMIWIKRHRTGRLYPKIEFDAFGQELQYGMSPEGGILETRFKSFNATAGPVLCQNMDKSKAHPLLQRMDDVISQGYAGRET